MSSSIYSCANSVGDCAEVIGLSSDDQTGEIHFLAQVRKFSAIKVTLVNLDHLSQYPNGTMALFELNQDDRTPHLLSTSADLPA
ncbi:unnamed protein product [Cylicostephanus goldi]|uniref:Rol-3 five-bladed beta-propeller domain-containing protein n=1 Tax=Cylicostephanus goldi TaxID=71465 RepID=A0A3P6QT67_CYLGO|nr:unnamed protein product [Cylicostephanus goldi]